MGEVAELKHLPHCDQLRSLRVLQELTSVLLGSDIQKKESMLLYLILHI